MMPKSITGKTLPYTPDPPEKIGNPAIIRDAAMGTASGNQVALASSGRIHRATDASNKPYANSPITTTHPADATHRSSNKGGAVV